MTDLERRLIRLRAAEASLRKHRREAVIGGRRSAIEADDGDDLETLHTLASRVRCEEQRHRRRFRPY